MYTRIFAIIMLTMILMNCGSVKRMVTPEEIEKINTLTQKDTIKMVMQWASPQNVSDIANINLLPVGSNAGNINLIGNPNYFIIIGDSLSIELPYYGQRQLGGTYNPSEIGISFQGEPKVSKQSFNEKKKRYEYYFEVNNNNENFQINLNISPNLRTDLRISSSHRTLISYSGWVVDESS